MKNFLTAFSEPIIAKISSKLARGSFNHNVLVLFAGTMLGQMSTVILAPLLTRIYSPEEFGVLGVFSSLLMILLVVASLRYELALPLARTKSEIVNLLVICFVVLIGTTLLFALIIAALPFLHTGLEQTLSSIWPYRWLLPLGFLAMGGYQIMVSLATRQGEFGAISRTKIYQGVSGPVTQIGLGYAGAGVWGMLAGFIVGQSMGFGLLISKIIHAPKLLAEKPSIIGIKLMARRFKRFPLISSWSGLINVAGSTALLLVVIPFMFSSTIAGFIFLTDRVIGRPLLLITTSILQVYVGDIAKSLTSNPAGIRRRFLRLAAQQTVIVSFWLLIVNICAPTFFPIIFGEEWAGAVPYLQVLSISYLFQMVMHSFTHTLQILERQGLSLIWEVGRLVLVGGAFAIGIFYNLTALETLMIYSGCQAFAHIVLFFFMYASINSLQVKPVSPELMTTDGTENS